MKTRKQFLTSIGVGLTGVALAGNKDISSVSNDPQLEFAFTATITLGVVQEVGITPHGKRRVIPITGGSFAGPAIKGTVEPGGADWQQNWMRNTH
jgi:hypothetical protein